MIKSHGIVKHGLILQEYGKTFTLGEASPGRDLILNRHDTYKIRANILLRSIFPDENIRIDIARFQTLPPGGKISLHSDPTPEFPEKVHIFHIPIETNTKAWLKFGDEVVHMKKNTLYEVDYTIPHEGANDGNTDRIHFFIEALFL